MRTGKAYLFRACCSNGISHHHPYFGKGSMAGGEWAPFIAEKGEGFRSALIGGCWWGWGVAGGTLTTNGGPLWWVRDAYLVFSGCHGGYSLSSRTVC